MSIVQIGKSVREAATGRVLFRVKRRDDLKTILPNMLRAPAAMRLLDTIVIVCGKRNDNEIALDAIRKQKAQLEAAEKYLLAEREKIDAALAQIHGAATTFVQAARS